MWTKVFWQQAIERAVKSAAQAFIATGVGARADVLSFDFATVAKSMALFFVLSIMTSLASSLKGDPENPSLV